MSRKENILLVANWESDVGYAWWLMENFWAAISEHFMRSGKNCYLIYPAIGKIPDVIASSGIKTTELDFKNHSLPTLKKLYRLIRENNIKYVYLTDYPSYSPFYILLRLWGIKTIVVHDHTPGDRTLPSRTRSLAKAVIQNTPFITADHFIAVTEFVYQRFINVACIPGSKCSCATNGIDPIDLGNCDNKYTYDLFKIPQSRKIIVTTGRASYYKGIDFFIECANILVNKLGRNDLHFLYCGTGPDIDNFKALADKYNLNNHFTFAGNRTDIRNILPSCHIGFHAATGEVGYSLSILEYMSAGLLTIVPDRPSTSLATRNMETGFLYKYRDAASATNAILCALGHQDANSIRRSAIKEVQNKYNIKDTKKQLVNILSPLFHQAH